MNKFNKSAIAVFLLVATSVPSFAAVSVKKAIDAIPQAYILARAECPELEKASKAIRNEVDSDKVDAWEKQVPQEAWFKTWIQECSAEADKLMKNHNVREAQIVFYAPGKSEDKDVLGLYTKTLANPGKPTVSVASNQASSLFISKLIGFQSPADVLWVDYNVNCYAAQNFYAGHSVCLIVLVARTGKNETGKAYFDTAFKRNLFSEDIKCERALRVYLKDDDPLLAQLHPGAAALV